MADENAPELEIHAKVAVKGSSVQFLLRASSVRWVRGLLTVLASLVVYANRELILDLILHALRG